MKRKNSRSAWIIAVVSLLALLGCDAGRPTEEPTPAKSDSPTAPSQAGEKRTPTEVVPDAEDEFTALIRSEMPRDVDPQLLERLRKEGKGAQVQSLFERLSWQSFVALNWPTGPKGAPLPALSDHGEPAWTHYKESFDVFRPDGAKPKPWGEARGLVDGTPSPRMSALPATPKPEERLLFTLGAKPRSTTADELDQAFTFPLWDQSGNIVFYEVLLNRAEFNYLVDNELYNLDGQVAFSKNNPGQDLDPENCNHPNRTVVVMPSGRFGTVEEGAIEIKLAWKLLTDSDIEERYVTADGWVPKDIKLSGSCDQGDLSASIDGENWKRVKLGLVGLHISHKTDSSPQWVWSTFEQVDNLAVDALEAERYAAQGKKLAPSFADPTCDTCLINTCVMPPEKNQLQRVIPISEQTASLNLAIQERLAAQNSPLRYYELVGVQYPTEKEAKPTSPRASPNCSSSDATPINLPESVDNKAGGRPHPTFLTNMTMESFFQTGNQAACNQVENGQCPSTLPKVAPKVFATESCIGCHSSSAIAVGGTPKPGTQEGAMFGNQLTADFSWLLQMKAYWKK